MSEKHRKSRPDEEFVVLVTRVPVGLLKRVEHFAIDAELKRPAAVVQLLEWALGCKGDHWEVEVLAMVEERLGKYPCRHGVGHGETAPMFFPEWISCVVDAAKLEATP